MQKIILLIAILLISSSAFAVCNHYTQLAEGLYHQDVNGTITFCSPGDINIDLNTLQQCQKDLNQLKVDYNSLDQNTGNLFQQINTCNSTNTNLITQFTNIQNEKENLQQKISDLNIQIATALASKNAFETTVNSLNELCGGAKSASENTYSTMIQYQNSDANQTGNLLQQQSQQITTCQSQNNTIKDMNLGIYALAFLVFILLASLIIPKIKNYFQKRKQEKENEERWKWNRPPRRDPPDPYPGYQSPKQEPYPQNNQPTTEPINRSPCQKRTPTPPTATHKPIQRTTPIKQPKPIPPKTSPNPSEKESIQTPEPTDNGIGKV